MLIDGNNLNCKNCRYSRRIMLEEDHEFMACHRFPPTIVNEKNRAIWPIVHIEELCGEHEYWETQYLSNCS